MNKQATIVSTIVQFLVAVNMALMALGITQFENVTVDIIYTVITPIAALVAWGWGLWKNHNFTEAARIGQSVLNAHKKNPHEELSEEEQWEEK